VSTGIKVVKRSEIEQKRMLEESEDLGEPKIEWKRLPTDGELREKWLAELEAEKQKEREKFRQAYQPAFAFLLEA